MFSVAIVHDRQQIKHEQGSLLILANMTHELSAPSLTTTQLIMVFYGVFFFLYVNFTDLISPLFISRYP